MKRFIIYIFSMVLAAIVCDNFDKHLEYISEISSHATASFSQSDGSSFEIPDSHLSLPRPGTGFANPHHSTGCTRKLNSSVNPSTTFTLYSSLPRPARRFTDSGIRLASLGRLLI